MLLRIFLFLLPVICFSQRQYRFEHLSIKNGLSQNTVHCVLKDSEGYYWLGTQDGLNRYDGYSMKVFRHDKDDSTTISDNFILTLLEDKAGNLWVGTRNGFNYYDKRTQRFTKIISNEKERNYFHATVWSTFLDKDGNVLYSNHYGQLVSISQEDSKAPPFSPRILNDNCRLFKSSARNYSLMDQQFKGIRTFGADHSAKWNLNNTSASYIHSVIETENGDKIVATDKGLYQAGASDTNLRSVKSVDGNLVYKLLYDSHHNLWVGTGAGLYVFTNADLTSTPQRLVHSRDDVHSLGSNSVQELYEDPDGLIWVGTSEGGVSVYDPQNNIFKILNHNSPISLSGNSVWGIYQDKNELWVGTNSGLNHLCFEDSAISKIYSGKNKLLSSEVFTFSKAYPNCIAGNSITCITKDQAGNLWFASNNNGISIYNPLKKTWKQINTKNSPLRSDHVFHLLRASDGKIWISTLAGFYSYDPKLNTFRSFLCVSEPGGTFPSGYIISIFEDKERTIWVGSTIGVYHLTAKGETLDIYESESGKSSSLSYNMATSFCQDSRGRLWIATLGGGIDLFDPKTKNFKAYTQKDGLDNDIIYQILEDRSGKLWTSSNSGISCFNPEKKTFINFTERDGLVAKEFSQNAGFINGSGEILFGSPEGLVVFDPAAIKDTPREIPLTLTSLKVNYEPVSFSPGSSLDLNYGDKTVTFEFTAPDFRSQEKIHYAFRLEGFDDTWREVPASNRIASFTSLPFGNYIFKVRVRNGHSPWQEKQLAIPIHVIPPFWMQTWFVLLVMLAGLTAIVLLVRYYAQRKLKKRLQLVEIQQKIHLEKERISRDLHDNVGAHLTYIINSLDNISYKMDKGEKNIPSDKISSLSDFSRSTMQQLRESIWAINKENITLAELKDKIGEYSGRMASASNMNFNIEWDAAENSTLKPSHAINIYRVVQEAVNNSVKHSEAQNLSVSIGRNGDAKMYIDVRDNGKGMNPEATGNGYGLKNMQDRVKDLGGEILIDSGAAGTRVSFTIPL